MMRITAGIWRGRRLPVQAPAWVRPTMDRVRQALFDRLQAHSALEGKTVADLFAGTGALGLEALSRGAGFCLFVERDRHLTTALRQTLQLFGAAPSLYRIITADAFRVVPRWQVLGLPRPELVLADPPYGTGLAAHLLRVLALSGWLPSGSLLCLEVSRWEHIPSPHPGWELQEERLFGETRLLWWYWHGIADATGTLPRHF